MPMRVEQLGENDMGRILQFLTLMPERNIVPLANVIFTGLSPGESPFHGTYLGCSERGGPLEALLAVYNIGSLFFDAKDNEQAEVLARRVITVGLKPRFLQGEARLCNTLAREFDAAGAELVRHRAKLMVLKHRPEPGQHAAGARAAVPGDLDEMVRLTADFEMEAMGRIATGRAEARELLSRQVDAGTATVVEMDGMIVSKAWATSVPPYGAQLGGVYTVPGWRGRGCSTACTGALCSKILEHSELAALAVEEGNESAKRVYLNVGFEEESDWMFCTVRWPGK